MGRSQQKKGRNGELELVKILNDYGFQVTPGRVLTFGSEPDITGLSGIHIEVKRQERLRLNEWMKQASEDAEKFNDGLPTVFHRQNRQQWLVTMKLSDWIKLYNGRNDNE